MLRRIIAFVLIIVFLNIECVLSATLPVTRKPQTNGNLVNTGLVAQSGDWTYYVIYTNMDNYICYGDTKLYKVKKDGTQKKLVTTGIAIGGINIVGDWIYYMDFSNDKIYHQGYVIYKIRSDGTKKTQVSKKKVGSINIDNDWIYYIDTLDSENIYKMKLDGSHITKLVDIGSPWNLNVGDSIFYVDLGIYTIGLDGKEKKQIGDFPGDIILIDNWIYGTRIVKGVRYIYKMKTDGTEYTVLKTLDHENQYLEITYNTDGDWVYYSDAAKSTLSKISVEGTNETDLIKIDVNPEIRPVDLLLTDEWVYYYMYTDTSPTSGIMHLYRIKKDGSKNTLIK